MTDTTDNATMENLADDALNEFDMKYDGPEEDNSPRKSGATNLDNQTAGGKESEGKNVEVGDGKDDNATQEEDRWDDEAKSGENDEEGNDLEVDVGQKSEIDQATESGGGSGVLSNNLWGLSNVNDPYGAFKLQDKTPQELAEEAAQQQAMWVAYVEELSEAMTRRQNMVVRSTSSSEKHTSTDNSPTSQTSIKDNENLDGNVDQGPKAPITLFSLCEQFDNVTTILADKTDDGMDDVASDDVNNGWSEQLINVLCDLLPQFKDVLSETPLLVVPSQPSPLSYPEAQEAAPPITTDGTLPSSIVTTSGSLSPRCGILRVKVCAVISELVRLRVDKINKALVSNNLVKTCIDLMFKYDCNNILHNAVTSMSITILEGSDTALQKELLEKCDLLNRILKSFEDNEAEIAKDKSRRRPYMGQLTQIAQVLNEVAITGDRVFLQQHIKANAQWPDFVETTLTPLEELHSRQIGGAAPPRPVVMQDEMNQGDIWNSLAKILSSFKGDGDDNDGGEGGGLDLATLMAHFGALDQGDDDDEDDEDDEDDSNATPEQEPQSMSETNVYSTEDNERIAGSAEDGRDEGKASESHE